MEMAQLWVNLPARLKMSRPRYQSIGDADIPVVSLDGGESRIRVIAGSLGDTMGPAGTFTPMNVWDAQLSPGTRLELHIPKGHVTMVALLRGAVSFGEGAPVPAVRAVALDREDEALFMESKGGAAALVLTGEPIDEPIVGHGPFVMNTPGEIYQAIGDYRAGRMGRLP
jgi:redox-sensitive bicupin YhaK (pirin superfamily)